MDWIYFLNHFVDLILSHENFVSLKEKYVVLIVSLSPLLLWWSKVFVLTSSFVDSNNSPFGGKKWKVQTAKVMTLKMEKWNNRGQRLTAPKFFCSPCLSISLLGNGNYTLCGLCILACGQQRMNPGGCNLSLVHHHLRLRQNIKSR